MDSKVAGYVQEKILAMLDKGVVPWQKPWKGGDAHRNLISGKEYRGINTWLLSCTPTGDFKSNYWMTMNQANAKKWQVKKGSKATMVIYWKVGTYEKDGEEKKSFLLRYYNVFNSEQVEGAIIPASTNKEHKPIEEAQAILDGYVNSSKVTYSTKNSSRAFYSPSMDSITVPLLNQFETPEQYYSTAFHECVHSTGHKSRLNRLKEDNLMFESHAYSFEELVAESGACMLDALVGIDTDKIYQNATAYIKTWRDRIAEDVNLVIKASSKAQKAVDLITGNDAKVKEVAQE